MRNLMKPKITMAVGIAVVLFAAAPAMAVEAKIYRYDGTSENYCPTGLQPITISGVVCCGVPNQAHSYQQVMTHPAPGVRHHKVRNYSARPACREGTKGCS
jgi:hypothetical protein